MGRPRPADFVRLAQQFSARQPDAFRADQPRQKSARRPPAVTRSPRSSAGSIHPPSPAVLNEWFQARYGQRPSALALDSKAVTDRLAQCVRLVLPEISTTLALAPVRIAPVLAVAPPAVSAARALFTATDLAATVVSLDARPRQLRDRPHHRFCRWRVADPNRY